MSSTGNSPWYSMIVSDTSEHAVIIWQDNTNTTSFYPVYGGYISVQRIDNTGSTLWTHTLCTSGFNEVNPFYKPMVVNDGIGGAIITWTDYRSTTGNPGQGADIYAQKVNSNGSTLLALNGVAICTAVNDQTVPMIASNGAGGAVIVWQDYRNSSDWDIYAQSITGNVAIEDWVG